MVPSGVRRAGVRASGAPGAKLLAGAERNHGGKRGPREMGRNNQKEKGKKMGMRLGSRKIGVS